VGINPTKVAGVIPLIPLRGMKRSK